MRQHPTQPYYCVRDKTLSPTELIQYRSSQLYLRIQAITQGNTTGVRWEEWPDGRTIAGIPSLPICADENNDANEKEED